MTSGFVAGPAESLFKESYYQLMKAALRKDGILCSQGKYIKLYLHIYIACLSTTPTAMWKKYLQTFKQTSVNFTGESQWLHLELIKEMWTFCRTLFPVVNYAYSTIPTYPSGQIGFMLCGKDAVSLLVILNLTHFYHWLNVKLFCCSITWPHKMTRVSLSLSNQETNFKEPVRALAKEDMEKMNLKYYNPEIHKASFVLPEFARKVCCWILFFFVFDKCAIIKQVQLRSLQVVVVFHTVRFWSPTGAEWRMTSDSRSPCASSAGPSDHR